MLSVSRLLLGNGTIATMEVGKAPYGLIHDGALPIEGDRIVWCGAKASLPANLAGVEGFDLAGPSSPPASSSSRRTH